MGINIKGKIWKTGNGFVVTIPKTLIECGILKEGDNIEAMVNWEAANPLEAKPLNKKAMQARRAMGPMLSLVKSFTPDFSSIIAQESLLGAARCSA